MIGSGSLVFEMIRALVNKLSVMVTPRWVRTPTQPIAIQDVIAYLVHGLDVDGAQSAVVGIGGPDRMSYGALMREYAGQIGVRRLMVPVPFLTTRLSSLWLGLVTPLYARIGKKLIDSLRTETIVQNPAARTTFPVHPPSVREASARALQQEDREMAETRWSDAVSSSGEAPRWGGRRFGSRLVDRQQSEVRAEPGRAFAPIQRIGGRQGWYFATWLWYLRFLDLLVGGWECGGAVGIRWTRPGLVAVRGGAGGRRQPDYPDSGLRSARTGRAPLLVRPLSDPLVDLPADAAVNRAADRQPALGVTARTHSACPRILPGRGLRCQRATDCASPGSG